MFGTISIPPDLPEGVTIQEWYMRVGLASQMMQVAADNRRAAKAAAALRYADLAVYHSALGATWAAKAADQMAEARNGFAFEAIQEALQARHMVRAGNVRFLEPACAGETCEDCERPLWHHILVDGARQLCPFGREYWSLARALFQRARDDAGVWPRADLREIAKR